MNRRVSLGGTARGPEADAEAHAFVALYRARYEQLCRFAFRYVRSQPDAEEIVHEVFLRLWTKTSRDERREAVDLWVKHLGLAYAAVRNEAIDRLRRRRRETIALESVAASVAD